MRVDVSDLPSVQGSRPWRHLAVCGEFIPPVPSSNHTTRNSTTSQQNLHLRAEEWQGHFQAKAGIV